MCAIARHLISQNIFGQYLSSESLKGPGSIPLVKACTIMTSSLVFSLTTWTQTCSRTLSRTLPDIVYVKDIIRNRRGSLLIRYCSLNSVVNWLKVVMCPSWRLTNHSNVALANVLINNLQYTTSNPPVRIIWVWNAVR